MQYRKFLIPVALAGSLGIALAPTLATAASSSHTASTAATSTVSSAAAHSGFRQFGSPASDSVRHSVSPRGANPGLEIALLGDQTSSRGIGIDVIVANLVNSDATLTLTWGDGQTSTQTVNANTTMVPLKHQYADLGTYKVSATLADGLGDTATNSTTAETAGIDYVADGPYRVLDTRKGLGAPTAAVAPHGTLKFKVVGTLGSGIAVPATAQAVVLNVTVTQPSAGGVLTAYGDEDQNGDAQAAPDTSNLNFAKGATVANLVVAGVGANGVVDFYNNSAGTTQVIADLAGYFVRSNVEQYYPTSPTRILDTRKGIGTGKVAKVGPDGHVTLTVGGDGLVPSSANAVDVNITAVNGSVGGNISAYSGYNPTLEPITSNVNYGPGQTVANNAIVPLGKDSLSGYNQITLYNNSSGTVDLIADVSGYFDDHASGGGDYIPLPSPMRIFDSRQKNATFTGPFTANHPVGLPLSGFDTFSPLVVNATVTSPTNAGYLALFPYNPNDPNFQPSTSTLNYAAGQTVPNLAFARLGTVHDTKNNSYDLGVDFGGSGTAQLVLDEFGYFNAG
jgi:hypothetical protein